MSVCIKDTIQKYYLGLITLRMCPVFFILKRLDILEHILEGGGIIII